MADAFIRAYRIERRSRVRMPRAACDELAGPGW